MSEGRVPMVVAGLEVAADIFAEDVELAYRSIVLRLQPLAPGEASQRLILVLARGMGLIEPERLAEPDMAEFIWRHSRSEEPTPELQPPMRTTYAVFCWKTKT